jgi:hypothetical protein
MILFCSQVNAIENDSSMFTVFHGFPGRCPGDCLTEQAGSATTICNHALLSDAVMIIRGSGQDHA